MSFAECHSCCEFVFEFGHVMCRRRLSVASSVSSLRLEWREGVSVDVPYKYSLSCSEHFGKLCMSLFTAVYCKREFLSSRLFIAPVYVYKCKYLENNVISRSFSENFIFYPGDWNPLSCMSSNMVTKLRMKFVFAKHISNPVR